MFAEVGGFEIGRLSEGQKDCLRLVLAHMTSKEIARHLGISSHTVDQRLRFAIRTMGARTRMQAALMLSEAEQYQHPPRIETNVDVQSKPLEVQSADAHGDRLMHQPARLPSGPDHEPTIVRRSALDPDGLYRFTFSSTTVSQNVVEKEFIDEDPGRGELTPAHQPGPAGELSKTRQPQELHLRWHQKLLAILLIGVLLIMAAGSLLVGIDALARLLR